ncbi:hypothetical protein DVH24_033949 [Malus domestica]|uniref:Uncharacterized protein n=1 Tax=Malus domestica TaxID=3750 RepID=A0A498KUA7_MALDO|nr:hypothetical protein DVH24_033949 [Malus domestica]
MPSVLPSPSLPPSVLPKSSNPTATIFSSFIRTATSSLFLYPLTLPKEQPHRKLEGFDWKKMCKMF